MAMDFPSAPVLDQIYTSGGASYVWNGYAWVRSGATGPGTPSDYVLKAGDTMTGPLILSEHPALASPPLQAATKDYVDLRALPPVGAGVAGQALVLTTALNPAWGAPISGGGF